MQAQLSSLTMIYIVRIDKSGKVFGRVHLTAVVASPAVLDQEQGLNIFQVLPVPQ
jgi:hypothetical protein